MVSSAIAPNDVRMHGAQALRCVCSLNVCTSCCERRCRLTARPADAFRVDRKHGLAGSVSVKPDVPLRQRRVAVLGRVASFYFFLSFAGPPSAPLGRWFRLAVVIPSGGSYSSHKTPASTFQHKTGAAWSRCKPQIAGSLAQTRAGESSGPRSTGIGLSLSKEDAGPVV
jgi:hypothetical protein